MLDMKLNIIMGRLIIVFILLGMGGCRGILIRLHTCRAEVFTFLNWTMNQVDLERVWELNLSAPFPSFLAPLLPKTTANEQFVRLRS